MNITLLHTKTDNVTWSYINKELLDTVLKKICITPYNLITRPYIMFTLVNKELKVSKIFTNEYFDKFKIRLCMVMNIYDEARSYIIELPERKDWVTSVDDFLDTFIHTLMIDTNEITGPLIYIKY